MKYLILIFNILLVTHLAWGQVKCNSIPFDINEESDVRRWESPANSNQRKLKYGDVLHISLFTSAIPNGTGTSEFAPASMEMNIPIRHIGPIGKLKDYEKAFLLSFLLTNAKSSMQTVYNGTPTDSLVNLWNYLMDNITLVSIPATHTLRIIADFTTYGARAYASGIFGGAAGGPRLIVWDNFDFKTIKNIFLSMTPASQNNALYDSGGGGNAGGYNSIYSFSVTVNAAGLVHWKENLQLRSWSAYDWMYSGIPTRSGRSTTGSEIDDALNGTKKIKFHSCRYWPRYKIIPDQIGRRRLDLDFPSKNHILGTGTWPAIVFESDVLFLYPPFVKKIILRHAEGGHTVRIKF